MLLKDNPPLIPVILSGGAGSRLWPLSRKAHPKPFLTLPDGESLLQKTLERASHFPSTEMIILTNQAYYLKTKAEYEKIKKPEKPTLKFLLEPFARNTASAIGLAACYALEKHGPQSVLLVLPADHLIKASPAFCASCEEAIHFAQQNYLVTFGIVPTQVETGYGYIECGEQIAPRSFIAKGFTEKPDLQTATNYFVSKKYLWNAGMFCFTAETFLQQLKQHDFAFYQLLKSTWTDMQEMHADALLFSEDSFKSLPDISIDYALMEKSKDLAVVTCEFDWQDLGSWETYKALFPTDVQGNAISGECILLDAQNNFIHSEDRLIAAIGIQNLNIIDTADALLITDRSRSQDVKDIVSQLKSKAHESYLTHRTVFRPWGSYTILEEGPCYKIKRIVVKPGASLSLQIHQHRSEHWVVIAGVADIINGETHSTLKANESTFVPKLTQHRLSNFGTDDLIIIEVQTGESVAEEDIIRLEDNYGRTHENSHCL